MTLVHGTVADGFEEVRAAFAEGVRREPDIGAQLAVYRDGRLVVDLWAADTRGDALTGVYSVTKGAAYLVVALLVQDGLIGLDRSVRHYWPQFTPDVTVRELLGHRAGLIGVEGGFGTREIADDRIIAERLAKQRPYWKPGAGYGYHALVIGALVGEVVRRTTGRSLQQLYEERIRVPYGLDLYLGLPEELEPRFRKVRRPEVATATAAAGATAASPAEIAAEIAARVAAERLDPQSLAGIALNQHADPPTDLVDFANSRTVRALGQASAGGVGNARGIARLYAAAVTGVQGGPGPLLRPETIIEFGTPWAPEQDLFLAEPGEQFGVGFEAMGIPYPFLGPGAFGHFGAAGAVGFADPGSGLAYGYVRDRFPRPETGSPTGNDPGRAGPPGAGNNPATAGPAPGGTRPVTENDRLVAVVHAVRYRSGV
jgi:CubicO group peptidase (beta-lactamase class C family)